MTRSSLEVDHGRDVRAAKELQAQFDGSDLQLQKKVAELNTHKLEANIGGLELENGAHRDPAVVVTEVTSQIVSSRSVIVEIELKTDTNSHICESLNSSIWSRMRRTDM